jgi:hypothetical protein
MTNLPRIAAILLALPALDAGGVDMGGMDMAVMQKWADAKVVKYRVDGLHNAREPVVFGDYEGKADVLDRITVEFSWDVKKRKIIPPVTMVSDAKTTISKLKSDKTNCPPPQLRGEYEHFQAVSHSVDSGDRIKITGTRTFPPASVSNYPASCSMRAVPGGKEQVFLFVAGVGPEALGMPKMAGGPIFVSADRTSFSIKGAENWAWTFTPTLVR